MAARSAAVALSAEAYSVLFLHTCKHPHRAVSGLLLGQIDCDAVHVSKALPLFHSSVGLSPMLEIGLMLADEWCKQHSTPTQIVGLYQANEVTEDLELGPFAHKIAEKICLQCPTAAVLKVDGATKPTIGAVQLLSLGADGKRCDVLPTLSDAAGTLSDLERYVSKGLAHEVVDFDAHLDDPSKDWFNTGLFE